MKIIVTALFCITTMLSFSQSLEGKIGNLLDSFSLANPQEKTYIQTDRTGFIAGETVWFKTYATLFEKPSELSKVVYVILTTNRGRVLQKKQLKLMNGSAAGALELPSSLPSGRYYLGAYTLWMLNFPDYICTKKINVYNSGTDNNNASTETVSNEMKLQFFPEGGQLVAGLASNVAFKAINEKNHPVRVSGTVMNSKNKSVATFATLHDGMGIINFVPEIGESYAAVLNENVSVKKVALPKVLPEGITLTCDNTSAAKSFIKLERAETNKGRYNELMLVAQQHYKVVYMAKINFDDGLDAAAINKKNLLPGILQITVFTLGGIPLAERSVFISNYDIPAITGSTANNTKRAKNSIEIDLSTFNEPDAAVSIINSQLGSLPFEHNILSGLLLSSDIRGHIHQPATYFKDKSPATIQYLDILMMVNGWTRFNWADVMALKFPPLKYPFETGLSIAGKVTHVNGKLPLQSGKINLIIKGVDSTTILSEAGVNSQSTFVVSDIDFKKEANIYYQGTNQKKENALVSVKINPDHIDTVQHTGFAPHQFDNEALSIPAAFRQMLTAKEKEDEEKNKLLEEVVLKSRRHSVTDSVNQLYASAVFENSDQTLIMDDGHYFDMWQYLQRMVPGVTINKAVEGTQVNFNRFAGTTFFSNDSINNGVQLFLNEVPVSSAIIDNINPHDIGIIKVFKGITGIAIGADRGAIGFYTKKGVSTRDWRDKGFDFVKKTGYAVSREFYAMDYSKLTPGQDFNDVRPTLYWNPHVKITNGKAVVEFYNDDVSKKYKLILEGMDKNGELFSIEKIIE